MAIQRGNVHKCGVCGNITEVLNVGGGVHRAGTESSLGYPAFSVTVRPMQIDDFQLHYTYLTDEIDAGALFVAGLSLRL